LLHVVADQREALDSREPYWALALVDTKVALSTGTSTVRAADPDGAP
jgi:hypothetical protein